MVVDIADPALRDAVIDAPDTAAATLHLGNAFEVAAELDPQHAHGRQRCARSRRRQTLRRARGASRSRSIIRRTRSASARPSPPGRSRAAQARVWLPASAILDEGRQDLCLDRRSRLAESLDAPGDARRPRGGSGRGDGRARSGDARRHRGRPQPRRRPGGAGSKQRTNP